MSGFLDAIGGFFTDADAETGNTGFDNLLPLLVGAGTVAGVDFFQPGNSGQQVGYQGEIPELEAVRQQLPAMPDESRRPGSRGRRYFTDTVFASPDRVDEATAATNAQIPELQALNEGNLEPVDQLNSRMLSPAQVPAAAPSVDDNRAAFLEALQSILGDRSGGGTPVSATPPTGGDNQPVTPDPAPTPRQPASVDTSGLVLGAGGGANRSSGYDHRLTKEPGRTGSWVYQDDGSLIRDTSGADRYRVDVGGDHFEYYTSLGAAQSRAAEIHGDEYKDFSPNNSYAMGFAGGGMIPGGEDGMADTIRATLNGDEPIGLSGGEFIVPADVVSHLGNGNSNAGAKQLEALMGDVRKTRTGKATQAPQVDMTSALQKIMGNAA